MIAAPDIDDVDRAWQLLVGARHDEVSCLALNAYWRRRIRRQLAGKVRPGELTAEDALLIGEARGRLDGATWRADDEGRALLTIPIVEPRPTIWNCDPWASLVAVELVAVDVARDGAGGRARAWARMTGAVDVLGDWRLDDSGVYLYPDPWSWLRAVIERRAGRSHACILDEGGDVAGDLLLGRLLGCRSQAHAEAVEAQQKRARARLARRLVPSAKRPMVMKASREDAA